MVDGTDEDEKVRCGLKLSAAEIIRQRVEDKAAKARAQLQQSAREAAERRKKNPPSLLW